jgi:hypothetical protein
MSRTEARPAARWDGARWKLFNHRRHGSMRSELAWVDDVSTKCIL